MVVEQIELIGIEAMKPVCTELREARQDGCRVVGEEADRENGLPSTRGVPSRERNAGTGGGACLWNGRDEEK